MTTEKEDTDPSTPSSIRPRAARGGYALRELGAREPSPEDPNRPTTDPGLGPLPASVPTPTPPPVSSRARGVVVPPPTTGLGPNAVTPAAGTRVAPMAPASAALSSVLARTKDSKDSVELLLDGMGGPRPERRKTTPQSDGEAAASYHAQHGLHPAHALREPGPKVVVERAPEPPASEPDTVPTPPPPIALSHASDTTFVPLRNLGRRIAMAVLAALLIVLAAFVGMDLVSPRTNAKAHAPGPQQPELAAATAVSAPPAPPPAAPRAGEPTLVLTTNPTAGIVAPATAPSEVEVAKPAVSVQADGPKRRRRSTGESDDIGEFKTSF
jgi:hypothetical protein